MTCDAGDAKALADIDTYGCHILHVRGDDEGPRFSYSIGIERTSGQPELLITGLKQEITYRLINEYNRRVRVGEVFEADRPYSGFLDGYEVLFRPVLEEHYAEYLGWGRWLYGGNAFRTLQLIWPSTKGTWPWQSDASPEYLRAHPLLCESDGLDFVRCDAHGTTHTTFICQHLLGARGVVWYSASPDDDNPWPDAWCEQCHVAYLTEGEWNDTSMALAGNELRLLCHRCYEDTRALCIPRFV